MFKKWKNFGLAAAVIASLAWYTAPASSQEGQCVYPPMPFEEMVKIAQKTDGPDRVYEMPEKNVVKVHDLLFPGEKMNPVLLGSRWIHWQISRKRVVVPFRKIFEKDTTLYFRYKNGCIRGLIWEREADVKEKGKGGRGA